MAMATQWTIDGLGEVVAQALATDYAGPANGQIRAIPDRRTIRYYSTLGLLDRPVAMVGRTAMYGWRHLLQLVAVKRLQAEGATLSEIQHRLAGAPDVVLEAIARLPLGWQPSQLEAPDQPAPDARRTGAFWAEPPEVPLVPQAALPPEPAAPRAPFFEAKVRFAVDLGGGVTLLLPEARPLSALDLEAIARAAQPLLVVLRGLGQ